MSLCTVELRLDVSVNQPVRSRGVAFADGSLTMITAAPLTLKTAVPVTGALCLPWGTARQRLVVQNCKHLGIHRDEWDAALRPAKRGKPAIAAAAHELLVGPGAPDNSQVGTDLYRRKPRPYKN